MRQGKTIGSLTVIWCLTVLLLAPAGRTGASPQGAQGGSVAYQVYNSYFESNGSGLEGSASYLVFTGQRAFDKVFGAAAVMENNRFLPENSFRSKMVVAVIKRGTAPWAYTVRQVTSNSNTLYVRYGAVAKSGGGATFASPLIVAVDRRNYASVVFIENGRKVGIVRPEAPAGAQSARRLSGSSATVREVKVYLVAPGDNGKIGRKIGCEDSLVPVTRSIAPTKEPLKAAVQQLLSLPPEYGQSSRLSNYWKGRNLRLQSVSLYRGTATLRIAGEVFVAGICDIPRITEQIEATARQFPSVKKVRVFIGNRPLAEALS